MNFKIYLLGLSHHNTSQELRQTLSLQTDSRSFLQLCKSKLADLFCFDSESNSHALKGEAETPPRLVEMALFNTCNRTEVVFVVSGGKRQVKTDFNSPSLLAVLTAWAELTAQPVEVLQAELYLYEEERAVQHFLEVACSLDSMVLGEPQVLGQVKQAYRQALELGTTGVLLNKLFHKAFFTAKKVRSSTALGSYAVSVSFAAVELLKARSVKLRGGTVLLLGSGQMAALAAPRLLENEVGRLIVASRTLSNAQALAHKLAAEYKKCQIQAIALSELYSYLAEADIVFACSQAPAPLVTCRALEETLRNCYRLINHLDAKQQHRPLFCIDVALPRNIEPAAAELEQVTLYDLDDLQQTIDRNLMLRKKEAKAAGVIVADQSASFTEWRRSLALQPTIVQLLERTQAIADAELAKTLKRIGPLDEETEAALRTMLQAVVKKINHAPITFIKRIQKTHHSGPRYVEALRNFFNLNPK